MNASENTSMKPLPETDISQGQQPLPSTCEQFVHTLRTTIERHHLAHPHTPVLLMVSGGSDSCALAYAAWLLRERGALQHLAMLHVNHCLRGLDSDADAAFVQRLAAHLNIPLFSCRIDIAQMVRDEQGNMEAIARRERYRAAQEALESFCTHCQLAPSHGVFCTAHTANDRAEAFFMRSIVGTGPGGFRAMRYRNGQCIRPLLDVSREQARVFLRAFPHVLPGEHGELWREDATNANTDHFRAYVRHTLVPAAEKWNPQFLTVLTRSMNLIADEDDFLESLAHDIACNQVTWLDEGAGLGCVYQHGFLLAPQLGTYHLALCRRVVLQTLKRMLGDDARIETASVQAILSGFVYDETSGACHMNSGYVANIQGNYAVSSNKKGVRVEPMSAFRARRKK